MSSIIKVTAKYIEFIVVDLKKVKIEVVLDNFTFNFYFINLNIEIYLVLKFDYGWIIYMALSLCLLSVCVLPKHGIDVE